MTKTERFGDAWGYSMEYQYRYFLAGFLAIPFIMVMTDENPLKAAGIAMFHSVVADFATFPGALLVSYVALRMGRSPTEGERRRAWTSAVVAVLLTWTGYSVLWFAEIPPARFLVRTLGDELAWVLHLGGCLLLSSAIGLVVGWALPLQGKKPA